MQYNAPNRFLPFLAGGPLTMEVVSSLSISLCIFEMFVVVFFFFRREERMPTERERDFGVKIALGWG